MTIEYSFDDVRIRFLTTVAFVESDVISFQSLVSNFCISHEFKRGYYWLECDVSDSNFVLGISKDLALKIIEEVGLSLREFSVETS